jgi:hypothetical protein
MQLHIKRKIEMAETIELQTLKNELMRTDIAPAELQKLAESKSVEILQKNQRDHRTDCGSEAGSGYGKGYEIRLVRQDPKKSGRYRKRRSNDKYRSFGNEQSASGINPVHLFLNSVCTGYA